MSTQTEALLLPATAVHFLLQQRQEPGALSAIHLYMMVLQRNGKQGLEPAFAVLAPHHHGIHELVGVLVENPHSASGMNGASSGSFFT